MSVRYLLPVVHNSHTPQWWLSYVEVDGWRNGACPECGRHQTDLFREMARTVNAEGLEWPLLETNGSDDHNQPNEGLEMGCGRNRNLRPECGRYELVERLRERARALFHKEQNHASERGE